MPHSTTDAAAAHAMTAPLTGESIISMLYVFALGAFLGYLVITRVPPLLHTPLMSATNAISGISLVASLVIAGASGKVSIPTLLGFIAVICATINVVGGFVITDRMLRMFRARVVEKKPAKAEAPASDLNAGPKVGV